MLLRVGVVGLGNIGGALASNLLKKGFPVTVFDLNQDAVKRIQSEGGCVASCFSEVPRQTDVTITSLPHPKVSEKVYLGEDGLLKGAGRGHVFIETSTVTPSLVRNIAEAAKNQGIDMMDAAIGGGVPQAREATISLVVGGSPEIVKRVMPVLEAISRRVIHVGPIGSGMAAKIVNNVVSHANMVIICEAIALGVKAGLDPEILYDVLNEGSGASFQLTQRFKNRVLKGNFEGGMKVDLVCKDSELALDMANELGVPLFMGSISHGFYESAKAKGLSELDYGSIATLWESLLNVKFRK